jgi:hypothetical protein
MSRFFSFSLFFFIFCILTGVFTLTEDTHAETIFATNGSTQIGSFPTALPNNSFRIDSSVQNTTNISVTSSDFVGPTSTTLTTTTGWTQVISSSYDDANTKITFGFNIRFNSTTYDGVYVGSNTYLTFGSGSNNYSSLSASNPAIPGVHMCAADNSYQKVFYRVENSSTTVRIRYEGTASTGGTVGSPTIVYEAVFYTGQSYFDVYMGRNARCTADTTAPTISSISSTKANGSYTVGEVIPITFTFSESVTSVGTVTATLETGAIDRTCTFTVSSASSATCNYTVQSGDTSSDLTVSSVSGTIRDAASNNMTNFTPTTNLAANKNLVIDTTAPTISYVTSTATNGSYRTNQTIPIAVVFSESVTVSSGTPQLQILTGSPITSAINYSSGSPSSTLIFNYVVSSTHYSSDLDYASTGALSLNSSTIRDTAGNNATLTLPSPGATSSLSYSKNIVIDTTAPTVSLSSTSTELTNSSPFRVTATFSEAVTLFVVGDISVTNGSASNFTTVSSSVYTFDITPTASGAVTITIPTSSAMDAAGSSSTISNTLSRTYDGTRPTATVTTSVASPTLQTPIPYSVTFSEAVTGFDVADISASNATLGNFVSVSSTYYTFDVSPIGHPTLNVDVTISVPTSSAYDAAGNGNSVSNTSTIRFDNHRPTTGLTSNVGSVTNRTSIVVTTTFSETVTGFTSGDISLTNGVISNFTAVSGTVYTITILPGGGVTSLYVTASSSQDQASNYNLISNTISFTYDGTSSTVSVTSSASTYTSSSLIMVTTTFSEAVGGFTISDISVTNGTAADLIAVSTTVYTFTVTPSTQGTVLISVPANSATDTAGNYNVISNTVTTTYDSTPPTLTEITAITTPTSDTTPDYAFSSTEAGTVSYSGSCAGTSTINSGITTTTFSALAEGTYNDCTIIVTDAAGNRSSPLVISAFTISTSLPQVVSITLSDTDLTTDETALVTIVFSKAVTAFSNSDITTPNSSLSTITDTGDSITWTGTLTPNTYTYDLTNIITIDLTTLTDLAGSAGSGTATSSNYTVNTLSSPTITTADAGSVSSTTAVISGAITATGGANASSYGFVYGTTSTYGNTTTVGFNAGTTTFSYSFTGLSESTRYYARAFAINPAGTSYGSEVRFDTLSSAKAITSFTISGSGSVNGDVHTVTVTLPSGSAVTALSPTIIITGASVSPASGSAQDFTTPVTYTVTAEDGTTQSYTVTVNVQSADTTQARGSSVVAISPSAGEMGQAFGSTGANALTFHVNGQTKGNMTTVTARKIHIQLNGNPRTVAGYSISLDKTFAKDSIFAFSSTTKQIPFTLPDQPNTYTVFVRYYSTTGHPSPTIKKTIIYKKNQGLEPKKIPQRVAGKKIVSRTPAQALSKPAPALFLRTLKKGDTGEDIRELQRFLNTNGFPVALSGPGSLGQETTVFGTATGAAIERFQYAHKSTILDPYGITKPSPLFGEYTKAYINTLRTTQKSL